MDLPVVVASSVIRSSHQGESHGGVYLVNLATGAHRQVLDWSDPTIDWAGRGADRGLRGIAFHGNRVYLAASDELFAYDRVFNRVGSFRNPYLKHCHEICVLNDRVYLTSTGFDSILELDLARRRFTRGWCLQLSPWGNLLRRAGGRPTPGCLPFDPEDGGGPEAGDTLHLNNVGTSGNRLLASGRRLGHIVAIEGDALRSWSRIPLGTHNAGPYVDRVLVNDTNRDGIAELDRNGAVKQTWNVPRYPENELQMAHLPNDHARQAFGRGLCAWRGLIIGGSSPATVSVYEDRNQRPIRSINLSMDVRNAIHGLEIWPWGMPD